VSARILDQLRATLGGAYTIERELAGGGMSRVFVATETALGRRVVVKVLPAEMPGQLALDRFKREISIAARLQHAHVVPLLTAAHLPFRGRASPAATATSTMRRSPRNSRDAG